MKDNVEGFEYPTYKCCLCGRFCVGYGNNPAPCKPVYINKDDEEPRCCDVCNMQFVIPARLAALARGSK